MLTKKVKIFFQKVLLVCTTIVKLSVYIVFFFLADVQNQVAAKDNWQTVKDNSLIIKEGSPLDFSQWVLPGPAGKYGRVVASDTGKLRFEHSNQTMNFSCASLAWSVATGGFPDHNQADLFAKQLRLHGYNLVRFHYVDAMLMSGRDNDFDFDPIQLDRWLYFLSALKREGIYWIMDAMTSVNGAIGGVYPHRFVAKNNLKERLYFDFVAQEHWRNLTKKILTINNPYTKIRVIEDPALIGVILVNEGGINYLALISKSWPISLVKPFNEWLLRHYATTVDLQKAWGELTDDEVLEKKMVKLPISLRERTARMADFQRFIAETEIITSSWMIKYIRDLGFKGLVTQYNNWVSTEMDTVRSKLEWIDMHNYHDLALSFAPGATIKQTSSLEDIGRYIRQIAVTRQANKSFSVTEYGQPFWNRYRFETGLMTAAMARLQDWDFTCIHAEGAIDLSLKQNVPRKAAMHPYGVGIDPVARASETLATLIQLRGDIRPASHAIRLDFSGQRVFKNAGIDEAGDELSLLSWLTRVYKDANISSTPLINKPVDEMLTLEPFDEGNTKIERLMAKLSGDLDVRLITNIEKLRLLKVLPQDNITDIKKGVFQSETGEITLNKNKGSFKVVTSKTEAISSSIPNWQSNLKVLSVKNMYTEGLVAISSLDNNPLSLSKRILIVLATDAQNTNMRFVDKERRELLSLGQMPPQIKRGIAKIFLKLNSHTNFSLYRLHLNGDRGEKLMLNKQAKGVSITLDNFSFKQGPTTFFVLESN